jgi:Xaa-Pro aminopeptidase
MIEFDHAARVGRLQNLMGERDVDILLLSVGSDLPYFTGYEAMASERLTMLVVHREGEPLLFVPRLEAPRVEPGAFHVVTWDEQEDPIAMVTRACGNPERAVFGDHIWSTFLIALQECMPGTQWSPASNVTKDLRMVKDAAEVAALRRAAESVDRVLQRIPDEIRFSGNTEAQVSRDLARMTVEEGHQESSFAIVASGPNRASPHHAAGDRVIEDGDLVVCDFGGRLDGYYSDVTRTLAVGEPSREHHEVHAVVMAANQAGRDAVASGVPCQEIDRAARAVIKDAGYGEFFIHRTGHGIGLEVHEHPYMVEGNELTLELGMTFSVEPGIYLPSRFGVRIEDIVACGDSGADDFHQADRGLAVVG